MVEISDNPVYLSYDAGTSNKLNITNFFILIFLFNIKLKNENKY